MLLKRYSCCSSGTYTDTISTSCNISVVYGYSGSTKCDAVPECSGNNGDFNWIGIDSRIVYFLASIASIGLAANFILSAMAGYDILWYIFAAIVLMGGAGRSFGLDHYVIPWIKKWWSNTKFAREHHLYFD